MRQSQCVVSNLFVITGPPGSGKTPLLRELVAMGFAGVPEPAREVIAEQRAVDGNGVYDRDRSLFLELMLLRSIADFERVAGADLPVFFDRGIPDLIGYAELFGLDSSAAERAAADHRYNDLVFGLPSWREIYVTDTERRMTPEAAEAFGERVRTVYVDLGYTLVDVPTGSPAVRAERIVRTVGRHFGGHPLARVDDVDGEDG